MADRAMAMAHEHAPWGQGTAWWVTEAQVIVLGVIGLFLLLPTLDDNAADRLAVLGWIAEIGGVVLLLLVWRARRQEEPA